MKGLTRAAGLFLAGFLVATAADAWSHGKGLFGRGDPEERQERMLDRLEDKLDLTKEQKEKVGAVLKDRHEKVKRLHEELRPKLAAIHAESDAAIRAVLTPEQQKKFDDLRAKMKEKAEKGRKKDKD